MLKSLASGDWATICLNYFTVLMRSRSSETPQYSQDGSLTHDTVCKHSAQTESVSVPS